MRKWLLSSAAVMVLLFSSCEAFSNSWGESFARDPSTIEVTAGNVKDLLREAKGDTKTSRGILDKIAQQLKGNPTPDPTLQAAAVTAANQASGLGVEILNNTSILLGDEKMPDAETFKTLLDTVQNNMKANDLVGISDNIAVALPVTTSENGAPVFDDKFEASSADLTCLALALALAESEREGGFDNYIKTWTSGDRKIDGTGIELSKSEQVIAAITNKVASDPNSTLGKELKGLLEGAIN
ncbi:MAG: hypothetical protein LBL19_07140 [Spirochaetaceae bacterium]|jgi:hypothetical protein|nr:hypothetical protein [Spirochaetaceae bacterium]